MAMAGHGPWRPLSGAAVAWHWSNVAFSLAAATWLWFFFPPGRGFAPVLLVGAVYSAVRLVMSQQDDYEIPAKYLR
jgi:hypothetical protein